MESLKLSFEAVVPIFLLMLVGYVIKRIGTVDKKGFDVINKLVFKVFLPVLLFYNIYTAEISEVVDLKLILFTVISVLGIVVIGYFAVLLITKDDAKRGVILQSLFRSNYAILGIPLVRYICGEGSGALTAFMVVIIIPVFNILAVAALKRFGGKDAKFDLVSVLKGIVTNPLIIGCIIGLVFFMLDIKLPFVAEKAVKDISSIASPLSIIAIGAEFGLADTTGYLKGIIITVVLRLIVIPMIILALAVCAGFSGEALACILVTFGGPVAISSFAMAQQMGGDEKLTAQVVVISSGACIITFFGWIFTLSYLNLF